MKVTSMVCDNCGEPAIMTREIQGKVKDLCSLECAHILFQRDLERQENEERMVKQAEKEDVITLKETRKK